MREKSDEKSMTQIVSLYLGTDHVRVYREVLCQISSRDPWDKEISISLNIFLRSRQCVRTIGFVIYFFKKTMVRGKDAVPRWLFKAYIVRLE